MATANIAAPKFTIAQKLAHAHEMATEISEESSRQYCLSAILTGHIEADTVEKGLAEVLESRLCDKGQMYRLIDLLKEMQKEVAA
jgi:hypothetical protein